MLLVTLVTGIVFYFQDVNYSIILAILIGLSVLIPYVGAILVTIPVVIIGLFQWGLESSFYIYVLSYLLIQALDGNVLMPLLLGREVKLHPVYIITAVLIFGGIWYGYPSYERVIYGLKIVTQPERLLGNLYFSSAAILDLGIFCLRLCFYINKYPLILKSNKGILY